MKTITFSFIKGGVGKSSIAMLMANYIAKLMGTLIVDADPQHSTTFFYLPDRADTPQNLSNVLKGKSVLENIVSTSMNVNILPSSLELINYRNMELGFFGDTLAEASEFYKYCIIDTAPNLDNVTINCLLASDIIVTPVQFSNFDYKSALFYRNLLTQLGLIDKWRILFNKFKPVKSGGSIAAEYLALYNDTFGGHILKSRIPESAIIKQYFDTGSLITKAKSKQKIFNAFTELAKELTGITEKPEVF